MIKTYKDLRAFLEYEKKEYINFGIKKYIYLLLCSDRQLAIWDFQKKLRICEYFYNKKEKNILWLPFYMLYKSRYSIKGRKLGFDITLNAFDKGLFIAHTGSIIVGSAKIGRNCFLHGKNTISSKAIIGNDCELWVGASVMNKAVLADRTVVGAGAVVLGEFTQMDSCLVGVPAKKLYSNFISETPSPYCYNRGSQNGEE